MPPALVPPPCASACRRCACGPSAWSLPPLWPRPPLFHFPSAWCAKLQEGMPQQSALLQAFLPPPPPISSPLPRYTSSSVEARPSTELRSGKRPKRLMVSKFLFIHGHEPRLGSHTHTLSLFLSLSLSLFLSLSLSLFHSIFPSASAAPGLSTSL